MNKGHEGRGVNVVVDESLRSPQVVNLHRPKELKDILGQRKPSNSQYDERKSRQEGVFSIRIARLQQIIVLQLLYQSANDGMVGPAMDL